MSIQVKGVLEGNVFRKSQVELIIDGFGTSAIITTSIGDITQENGIITLKDGTQVPTGVSKPGTFDVEFQLAHQSSLDTLIVWAYQAFDLSRDGVKPEYKRNGRIIYHRLFMGGGQTAAGSARKNEEFTVYGMWPTSFDLPGGEMDSEEDQLMKMTISYDNIKPMYKGIDGL
jgi:hypothetical protein